MLQNTLKLLLDQYLTTIPDCPIIPGYVSHNMDQKGNMSNSLIDWNTNLKNSHWNLSDLPKVSKVPDNSNSANNPADMTTINPTIA